MTAPVIKGPGPYRYANEKARVVHTEDGIAFGFVATGQSNCWHQNDGSSIWLDRRFADITGPWHEPVEGWVVVDPDLGLSKQPHQLGSPNWRNVYVREVPLPHDEATK